MLKALNINSLRLLTNNPFKVKAIQDYGLKIDQVINTTTYIKEEIKLI